MKKFIFSFESARHVLMASAKTPSTVDLSPAGVGFRRTAAVQTPDVETVDIVFKVRGRISNARSQNGFLGRFEPVETQSVTSVRPLPTIRGWRYWEEYVVHGCGRYRARGQGGDFLRT